MEINGPFYLKELIYNSVNLKSFVSSENVLMLIEIIFDYVKNKNIQLDGDESSLLKIRKIITYFGIIVLNDISNVDDIESIKLVDMNKKVLKGVIGFINSHGGNLDVFEHYVSTLLDKKRLNEHVQIEEQLNDPKENTTSPPSFVNNEFINGPKHYVNDNTSLISLQEQINKLSKKYATNILDNIVIEKKENPSSKYVIKKLDKFVDEDANEMNICVEYLKSAILNNSDVDNIYKEKTREIINLLSCKK